MADLISRLAEIREQQGREPMPDPTKIAGFEGGQPLPPAFERPPVDLSQVPEGPAYIDEDPDFSEDFAEPSPLIPKSPQVEEPRAFIETPDLTVLGNDGKATIASYLGRQVELTEKEGQSVRRIVLQAQARALRAQLKEIEAPFKRKRRARKADGERALAEDPSPVSQPPPKRRGRPPKVRLDGGVR